MKIGCGATPGPDSKAVSMIKRDGIPKPFLMDSFRSAPVIVIEPNK